MKYWRLIPTLNLPGYLQMAIDSWLFKQHLMGNHPPVLRFYTWSKPTISLGYHQKNYPEFWQDLSYRGEKIDLVRRPTGGRAVLHQGDLTYGVIGSDFSGNRMEAYRQICEFLIVGWRNLGVELSYGNGGRGYIHNPNCFALATAADLVSDSHFKLIGSAQLRQGKGILQHGSMRLNQDKDLFARVFEVSEVCSFVMDNYNLENIINIFMKAAIDCFEIELEMQPLSDSEWEEIKLFAPTNNIINQ